MRVWLTCILIACLSLSAFCQLPGSQQNMDLIRQLMASKMAKQTVPAPVAKAPVFPLVRPLIPRLIVPPQRLIVPPQRPIVPPRRMIPPPYMPMGFMMAGMLNDDGMLFFD